jgi:hypothetical protein
MWTIFVGKWDQYKKLEYNIRYIVDTRETEKFSNMEVINDEVYLDGKLLRLNYDHGTSKELQPTVKTPVESGNEQGTAAEL